jgi:hypothetical protein
MERCLACEAVRSGLQIQFFFELVGSALVFEAVEFDLDSFVRSTG